MFKKYGMTYSYGHVRGEKWNWHAAVTLVKRKKWFVGLVVLGDLTYFSVGVLVNKREIVINLGFLAFRLHWL